MHILVVPTWYPNGKTDKLMGIYHKEYSEALALNKNIKVNMIYIDRQGLKNAINYLKTKKRETVKENGYNTYIRKMIDVGRISMDLQLQMYYKTLEKEFLEYIKIEGKPDVIHAEVTIPAGYACCKLGQKYNIPVVVTEHATYYERFFKDKNKKYGDYVLNHSYYTTVSSYMAKFIHSYGYNCDVLPNLVNTTSFNLPRKKVNGLKLVTVVALRKVKRVDDIIEALKIIVEKEKIENASLTVVGDGNDEDYFKNRCHELEMDKYVDFVGRKNKKEIAEILNESNIYVMSSEIETFGIPAIEALSAGLPVVATKCLGPEEYINSKNGKLIPINNPGKMAEAILDVYNHISDYDVSYLKECAKKYSGESITKKAIKIYKSLIEKK